MESRQFQQTFFNALGMACFLAFFVLLLERYTPVFLGAELVAFIILGVLFGALYGASAFLADRLTLIGPLPLTAFAVALCLAGALLLELNIGLTANLLAGACVVLGFVALSLVWGKNLSFYNHGERIPVLCATFILGGIIIALSLALVTEVMFVVLLCLPLLSLLHFLSFKREKGSYNFAALEASRKSYRFSVRPLLTTGLTGFVCGIAFFIVLEPGNEPYVVPLCLSLPLVLGGLVGIVDSLKGRKLTEESLLKSFPIASVLALGLLPFVPRWAQLLCGAYLFAVFSLDTMMNFSAIAETAHFNQLSPYWVFGVSLAYYAVGAVGAYALFGWAFACGVPLAAVGVCLGSIFLIVGMSDYVFTTTSYPGALSASEVLASNGTSNGNSARANTWKLKVTYVADTYDLTARQSEVLWMLSKGRTAQFVAKEFYISFSTAKAHIHNIYTKLGIHSQQELIDLVERAPLDSEKNKVEPPSEKPVKPRRSAEAKEKNPAKSLSL